MDRLGARILESCELTCDVNVPVLSRRLVLKPGVSKILSNESVKLIDELLLIINQDNHLESNRCAWNLPYLAQSVHDQYISRKLQDPYALRKVHDQTVLQTSVLSADVLKSISLAVENKWVDERRHLTEPLWIYNYSKKCQYAGMWNSTTTMCRGLILNDRGEIAARGFPKFFNHDERPVPLERWKSPFKVHCKYDGSLGILYFLADSTPQIATRGSFTSPQSIKATNMLHTKYVDAIPRLNRVDRTYLFEIVYPENKIVVDYKKEEKLVLLSILETSTGKDLPLDDIGFPTAQEYKGMTHDTLTKTHQDNAEGFVIAFPTVGGVTERIKIKFDAYKKIHAAMCGVSSTNIWRLLAAEQDVKSLATKYLPDEFFKWSLEMETRLQTEYNNCCKTIMTGVDLSQKMTAKKNTRLQIVTALTSRFPNHLKLILLTWDTATKFPEDDPFPPPVRRIIWQSLKPLHTVP